MATNLEATLLTAAEFLHLPESDAPTELVRGKVVEMNRPYTSHGYYLAQIAFLFKQFVQTQDHGRVVAGDAGIVTECNPDTVRGPDVLFYSYERIPRGPLPAGYWPASPELVLEIRSPDDRWKDILRKSSEYLAAGVLTVVVADPQTQRVHLFSDDRETTVLNANDTLTFPDILPGFNVLVGRLFE